MAIGHCKRLGAEAPSPSDGRGGKRVPCARERRASAGRALVCHPFGSPWGRAAARKARTGRRRRLPWQRRRNVPHPPLIALALAAPAPHPPRSARVSALTAAVDPARLRATVGGLVSFGTRHTLSETASETRGIGAARRWLAAEVAALSRVDGSRLRPFEDRFAAALEPRIPKPVEIVNVG